MKPQMDAAERRLKRDVFWRLPRLLEGRLRIPDWNSVFLICVHPRSSAIEDGRSNGRQFPSLSALASFGRLRYWTPRRTKPRGPASPPGMAARMTWTPSTVEMTVSEVVTGTQLSGFSGVVVVKTSNWSSVAKRWRR